jgi:hypothetical protein
VIRRRNVKLRCLQFWAEWTRLDTVIVVVGPIVLGWLV